jgi:hypothetical protein
LDTREFFIAWKRALSKIGCSITGDEEDEDANYNPKGGKKPPQPQQPPPKWPAPKDVIKVDKLPPINPNPNVPSQPQADPERAH